MDKKTLAIVIVLGVLLIGIITAVFIYDAMINTTILEVNGVKYSKADFESYLKVYQYEDGSDEPVDKDEEFNKYKVYKLFSQYADHYNVKLSSEDEIDELTDAEKKELEEDYQLSESEYMRVKTEIARVDELWMNMHQYYNVSDEDYEEHKGESGDLFKTYEYRVMQVTYKEEESSGDKVDEENLVASGDVSGDLSGDALEAAKEQAKKDATMAKAVEALAKVKSGEDFEEVAKTYGSNRFIFEPGGNYNLVNGTLEKISGYYMEDYVTDDNILNALKTLAVGEYSQIYQEDTTCIFVYLENIHDGLEENEDHLYRREIANEHIQGEAKIVDNKIVLKSIDLEKLMPILAKKQETSGETVEEENNQTENENVTTDEEVGSSEETSGDSEEVSSGEIE